jgi:PAS domain S-box-containing protein
MALHVVSDAAAALAYFAIPAAILWFLSKRADLQRPHRVAAWLFAGFMVLGGLAHLASIWVLWVPAYGAQGVLKAVAALASLAAAVTAPFAVSSLLRLPSSRALQAEVEAHRVTLEALEAARIRLAEEMALVASDLRVTTKRFEAALRSSPVTLLEQDESLTYTWAYNPPLGLSPEQMVGLSELDLFTADSAAEVRALKYQALGTRTPISGEVRIQVGDRAGWFAMHVEPTVLADGRPGIVATSTDVTARHEHENHLRMLMREMNHRAKNVLAIVTSLARQTARGFDIPDVFLTRFSERLSSLAAAHDVLAQQDWKGADLRAVIEGQLRHQLDAFGGRIRLQGGECSLPSESAHYVGLALHELGSNAVKHGALSTASGDVTVCWRITGEDGQARLELEWRERGGAAVSEPERAGFGSEILRRLVARAVNGASELTFASDGVCWRLTAPLAASGAPAA